MTNSDVGEAAFFRYSQKSFNTYRAAQTKEIPSSYKSFGPAEWRLKWSEQNGRSLCKPHHRTSNVSLKLSELLQGDFKFQHVDSCNETVPIAEFYSQAGDKSTSDVAFSYISESNDFHKAKIRFWISVRSSNLEISLAASEAYHKVMLGVWSVCRIYDVGFQEPLEAVEQSCEGIIAGVNTVLYDPPYNTRQIAELANSEHDQLRLKDMSVLVHLLWPVMDLKRHEHMFCSTL